MGALKKNKLQTTSGRPSDASVGEAIVKETRSQRVRFLSLASEIF